MISERIPYFYWLIKRYPWLRKLITDFTLRHLWWFQAVNVILTYRCNLSCEYCYERGTQFACNDMTLFDFESLLQWLKKNNKNKIILLGGEPTQHKEFPEILALCERYRFSVALLTNMLFDKTIARCLSTYKYNLIVQANVNHPDTYVDDTYRTVIDNVEYLYDKVVFSLRYNLYHKSYDSSDIIKLAKRTRSIIRFSLTNSPLSCEGKDRKTTVHTHYFDPNNQNVIRSFIEACEKAGVSAYFARPIPKCYFTKKEILRYKKNGIKFKCYIGRNGDYAARLNVNPDLTVLGCFGVPIQGPPITTFKTYHDVSAFYEEHFVRLRSVPAMQECSSCYAYFDGSCQGGCLSEREEWTAKRQ